MPEVDNCYRRAEQVWVRVRMSISREVGQFKRSADRRRREAPVYQAGYRV